jgi:transcriptional antiterminator RfaH
MPLLPPEPCCYPDNLFAAGAGDGAGERRWWVLHTKPRQEKSLARHLYRAATPFYLPVTARRCLVRGKVLNSYVPLFTGYVFLLGDWRERAGALTHGRVVHCLEVKDQERLRADLGQVHRLLSIGAPVTPEDRLGTGDLVEITAGPLAGLRGVIVREATRHRFVVQVNFIQQGASVLLDEAYLAAVVPRCRTERRA